MRLPSTRNANPSHQYDAFDGINYTPQSHSFVEEWFVGAHEDMGACATQDGLSIYPLQWMLKESADCGLRLGYAPKRKLSQDIIDDPLALAFQLDPPSVDAKTGDDWKFEYNNGILQDVRRVRQATTPGPISTAKDYSPQINYASYASGSNIATSAREIFDGNSLLATIGPVWLSHP